MRVRSTLPAPASSTSRTPRARAWRSWHRWALCLLTVVVLLGATRTWASDFSEDLAARRARVMDRLGPDTMLVLLSAPERVYSGDVNYEYHQDSNLYYLTGITQEDTALVLMPGNATRREILFVKDRNPDREHWTGRLLSVDEARERTGISTVLPTSDFESFIGNVLSKRSSTVDAAEGATFYRALAAGQARLALAMDASPGDAAATPTQLFLRSVRDQYVGYVAVDATPVLTDLRLVKTPYELKMLTRAMDISVDAQIAGMRVTKPGAFEYQVKAAIEAEQRAQGAVSWAYPSIVGSGPNATILHYPDADRQMQAGELLLVDAAANYGYQAADLTRTYPVSGTFSPVQRDIYELVLRAHEEAAKVAQPGATLATIHDRTVTVLKEGLLKLGLITDTSGQQYQMWFTHGTSHFVGLDVHDVGSRTDPLQPGATFTIEPGLYIRHSVLERLPRTDENLALIKSIDAAVTKYDQIGVRIEDSYVMESSGARSLAPKLPRTVKDVEALLRSLRPKAGSR